MTTDSYDVTPALGTVVEEERGSLPFALIHGEALVAAAAWSLGEAGVTAVDLGTEWAGLVDSGEPFVLHDSLCPMTPPAFIARCVRAAVAGETVVVGVQSSAGVPDTVCSPVVLPPTVVAALEALPSLDFVTLVAALRGRFPVEYVEAPDEARRVASPDEVDRLADLTRGPG